MNEVLNGALRWIFWGVLYLAIALVALLLFLASFAPYLPAAVRWVMLGVFYYGIALDIRSKARPTGSGSGPSDGDLTPVESRG